MEYLGAWGTLIHEKNLKSKTSCQTPFKINKNIMGPDVKEDQRTSGHKERLRDRRTRGINYSLCWYPSWVPVLNKQFVVVGWLLTTTPLQQLARTNPKDSTKFSMTVTTSRGAFIFFGVTG